MLLFQLNTMWTIAQIHVLPIECLVVDSFLGRHFRFADWAWLRCLCWDWASCWSPSTSSNCSSFVTSMSSIAQTPLLNTLTPADARCGLSRPTLVKNLKVTRLELCFLVSYFSLRAVTWSTSTTCLLEEIMFDRRVSVTTAADGTCCGHTITRLLP